MTWPPPKPENSTARASAETGTTLSGRVSAVSFTIPGQLPSMKNRRRQLKNRKTGKRFSAKSEEAVKYKEDFILAVPMECRNLRLGGPATPLRAIVTVFYSSWRSDLDCGLIYDALQAAGVIANDRFVREHHEYAHVDPQNPRVEILIEEI